MHKLKVSRTINLSFDFVLYAYFVICYICVYILCGRKWTEKVDALGICVNLMFSWACGTCFFLSSYMLPLLNVFFLDLTFL